MQVVYLIIIVLLLVYLSRLLEIKSAKDVKEQEIKGLLGETSNSTQESQLPVFDESFFEEVSKECKELWLCTDWADCRNNIQRRACLDLNNCKTINKKPPIEQSC